MKRVLSIITLTFLVSICYAQELSMKTGKITISSDKKNINSSCDEFFSTINLKKGTVSFEVPATNFFFKSGIRKKHWDKKVMETNTFPSSTFNGKITSEINFQNDGSYDVTVTGEMNIKGVTNTMTATGTIVVKGNQITINSTFLINRILYNVDGMYANMTDEDIKVEVLTEYLR